MMTGKMSERDSKEEIQKVRRRVVVIAPWKSDAPRPPARCLRSSTTTARGASASGS